MVLLLRGDVRAHLFDLRFANRKCGVTALPEEISILPVLLFDPFRGRFLRLLDEFCNRDSAREVAQNVNVVFHAAD
jgi:hypothetical protein